MRSGRHEAQRNHHNHDQADRFEQHGIFPRGRYTVAQHENAFSGGLRQDGTYDAPDRKWFEGSAWLANVN